MKTDDSNLRRADVTYMIGSEVDDHTSFRYDNPTFHSERFPYKNQSNGPVHITTKDIDRIVCTFANLLYPVMCLNEISTVIGVCEEGMVFSNPLARKLNEMYRHSRRRETAVAAYAKAEESGGVRLNTGNPKGTIIVQAFVYPGSLCPTSCVAGEIKRSGGTAHAAIAVFNYGVERSKSKELLGVPNLYWIPGKGE